MCSKQNKGNPDIGMELHSITENSNDINYA